MITCQQHSEKFHAIGKEAMSEIIKTVIRPLDPHVTIYCKQFDDAKQLGDFLERLAKYVREYLNDCRTKINGSLYSVYKGLEVMECLPII